MPHRLMAMPMGMRFGHRPFMLVMMMLIVHMSMLVLKQAMLVLMVVAFGQVHPEPEAHQCSPDE
jgi:hypothetical protein